MRTICVVFTLVLLGTFGAKEKHGKQSTEPPEQPFKASQWIPDIIRFVDEFDREGQPRNMEILDFFAGESNLCRRGRHRGFSCQTYDILHDKDQNILSYSGFFLGLLFCCQVQVFGLAVFGTQCSLWLTGLSQSIHRRAARGLCGAWENLSVYRANIMAENVAVLMLVLYCRQVHMCEENPGGTYLFRYETQAFVQQILGLDFIHTWLIFFGHWLPKPTRLMGSLVGMKSLTRKYSKQIWERRRKTLLIQLQRRNLSFRRLTAVKWFQKRWQPKEVLKKYPKANGEGTWFCAGKHLKSSGAYTKRFADALISIWESNRFNLAPPAFQLEELLHGCPFPMHDKKCQLKKSAGPIESAGHAQPQEEAQVDPTSRPSRCTCWYTGGPSCNHCRRVPMPDDVPAVFDRAVHVPDSPGMQVEVPDPRAVLVPDSPFMLQQVVVPDPPVPEPGAFNSL